MILLVLISTRCSLIVSDKQNLPSSLNPPYPFLYRNIRRSCAVLSFHSLALSVIIRPLIIRNVNYQNLKRYLYMHAKHSPSKISFTKGMNLLISLSKSWWRLVLLLLLLLVTIWVVILLFNFRFFTVLSLLFESLGRFEP